MLKYYALLVVVVGVALFYAFVKDPCNMQVRADLTDRFPTYEVLDSGATEGSPESVRCHISYKKPDGEEIYEAIWLYLYADNGWQFSRILETSDTETPSS
ncbi:MAG: hypothetical protein GY772_09040 [bacterium]|jgi:hypothetical protein|nr:hypothetical protein [Deltaproteobacteria bacterium]MCP4240692.1 hypothetical protein [bacterium]MDP7073083.1 hypothetical protein [Myxococcota bacterium]MDP7299207.1 hypothetical protein [Myxococcota bacterium]HJO23792.1 hypothetical protein [Myxococcota bacterium]